MYDPEFARDLATAVNECMKPLKDRIAELERRDIEKGAELRLLRELVVNSREQKHTAPDDSLLFPGESYARSRSLS